MACAQGASRCQTTANPKNGGRAAQRRSPLALRRCVHRHAGIDHPRLAGEDKWALRHRLTGLLGDPLWVPVSIPPAVWPADVVQHQQGDPRPGGSLVDLPQLLAHRVVVVVAVDDHRVRQRDVSQRLIARLLDQLQVSAGFAQFDEGAVRGRIDGDHTPAGGPSPVEQDASQIARVCPDLGHRLRAACVEAPEKNLGEIRQRMTPAGGIVLVGVAVAPGSHRVSVCASEEVGVLPDALIRRLKGIGERATAI
jgi:hypothetical protein